MKLEWILNIYKPTPEAQPRDDFLFEEQDENLDESLNAINDLVDYNPVDYNVDIPTNMLNKKLTNIIKKMQDINKSHSRVNQEMTDKYNSIIEKVEKIKDNIIETNTLNEENRDMLIQSISEIKRMNMSGGNYGYWLVGGTVVCLVIGGIMLSKRWNTVNSSVSVLNNETDKIVEDLVKLNEKLDNIEVKKETFKDKVIWGSMFVNILSILTWRRR